MSPTSCSIRISMVTMPAVPPNSSTTTAKWLVVRRSSVRAWSTSTVSGSRSAGRASRATVVPESTSGSSRSRMWTKPTMSSTDAPVTGYRECGEVRTYWTASCTGVLPDRNLTSVRGSITSRSRSEPASKTSSTISRSSAPSVLDPRTRVRISSAVTSSRPASGLPPSTRTARFGNQLHHRRQGKGKRLGTLQRQALGGQFAQHDRDIRNDRGDKDHGNRVGQRPTDRQQLLQDRHQRLGDRRAAKRRRQKAGQRHADLHCREEPVRIGG